MTEPTVFPVRADAESAEFFAAAAGGVLLLRRCPQGHPVAPRSRTCPACGSPATEWAPSSGRGRVVSWAVAGGGPDTVLGIVQTDEGPWLTTRLLLDPVEVREGARVEVAFARAPEGEAVPYYRGTTS